MARRLTTDEYFRMPETNRPAELVYGVVREPPAPAYGDLVFISSERSSIIRNHVWGAPDLIVEVASPASEYRDRTVTLSWYRKYGVRECWFVHPNARRIDVIDCADGSRASFGGPQAIVSRVLPELSATVEECF